MSMGRRPKALALISGGLDSILAARLVADQGVGVVGVGFRSHFFSDAAGRRAARSAGIPFTSVDIGPEMIALLDEPKYGFGKHLNPCVDCHRLMVGKAFELLEELEADFVVTGEVLGQRPKSQHRAALNAVAKAGEKGLLLRPLSAKLLAETIPEKRGWIDRDRLLGISGRGRKKQLELAAAWGITGFATPAGGCLLTDPEFCRRLKDLSAREGLEGDMIELLKVGRHFRSPGGARIVSGRDEGENIRLLKLASAGDLLFQAARPASLILLRAAGEPSRGDILLAASVCARYSKGKGGAVKIRTWKKGRRDEGETLAAEPMNGDKLERLRI